MKRRGFTRTELLMVVGVIVVLLVCVGFTLPLEFLAYILFGWALFLWRVLPQISVDWGSAALGLLALVLFTGGLHGLLRWFYRASQAARAPATLDRSWKVRWTAAVVSLIILMFVAGISMVGITHQIVWLAAADEPLATSSFTAHKRMHSGNNLKQISLALQNYHDTFESLPPGATLSSHGRVLHSWQTAILPFAEHRPLWEKIDHGKPWSDSANKVPMSTKIHCYQSMDFNAPTSDAEGYSLSHYAGNVHVVGGTRTLAMSEMTDGTSNTIVAGEAKGNFKPWGNPTNWRDPVKGINRSPDGFGSPWKGGALMVFVDGHVQFIRDDIDPKVLRALSTPAGGEIISDY